MKRQLLLHLEGGLHQPGDRFLSARALAERYRVSYQSAHLLLQELVEESYLRRVPRSGTYVAGQTESLQGCDLFFHPRAQRPESFGSRLLAEIIRSLEVRGIESTVHFREEPPVDSDRFPILWEVPEVLHHLAKQRKYGLVLARAAPPGRASNYLDSISIDDFSGGAAAAELILEHGPPGAKTIVIGGPPGDERSNERIRGFQSVLPESNVIFACGWYLDDGLAVAERALEGHPDAIFCCNDRLAQAIRSRHHSPSPFLIGFDDAPVAKGIDLNTIAIPWSEIAEAAAEVAYARITRRTRETRKQIFAPHPLLRESPEKNEP